MLRHYCAICSKKSIFLLFFLLPMACQNKPASTLMGDSVAGQNSPFDSTFSTDLNDSLAGNGNTGGAVGSGPRGNLTEADKQAIGGMTTDLQSVNTNQGGLSQELIDEAKRILDAENNTDGSGEKTAQIQQAKFALIGKILQDCAENIAPLAPVAGQPLMGVWKGGGACPVEFTVARGSSSGGATVGDGSQAVYSVTGGTQGQMIAQADGSAKVQSDPFSGNLTDNPKAGTGKLIHPTFNKTKSGTSPCEVGVNLEKSANPIPENYLEAMKQLGKCHRQALLFMSPVMDQMFKNMPQNLSSILLNRGIGVSR